MTDQTKLVAITTIKQGSIFSDVERIRSEIFLDTGRIQEFIPFVVIVRNVHADSQQVIGIWIGEPTSNSRAAWPDPDVVATPEEWLAAFYVPCEAGIVR